MSEPHKLTFKPQPMADQWMGECSCGWRTTASFHVHATREQAIEEINREHFAHLTQAVAI